MKLKTSFFVVLDSDIENVCADVGLRWMSVFPRYRQRGWGDDMIGIDAERMLQNIQNNFSRLTHKVPMVQVEDLLEAI